jgi:hypothetical protein
MRSRAMTVALWWLFPYLPADPTNQEKQEAAFSSTQAVLYPVLPSSLHYNWTIPLLCRLRRFSVQAECCRSVACARTEWRMADLPAAKCTRHDLIWPDSQILLQLDIIPLTCPPTR